MSEEPAQYRTRAIVFVSIPIPLDILLTLERLSTVGLPLENLASLMLAEAVREADERSRERCRPCSQH